MICRPLAAALFLATCASGVPARAQTQPVAGSPDRRPSDEVVYFVLPDRFANGDPSNDRGGLTGDRLVTGYDPTDKGFYHGGDLAGLTAKLPYLQRLGITAIWVAPIFRNKPVQGGPGRESAGYHGYWVTDFTQVDPHFGTDAEFDRFVAAAHGAGMKVYMDIITNHTADVIKYRDGGDNAYHSVADYPYSTVGGPAGRRINEGFSGDEVMTAANFARLTRPDFAYEPYVPAGEDGAKVPAWLNDPIHYHNRGDSTFEGESSRMGDFSGLDDLFTEQPAVVDGMIAIYGDWVDRGVDGFRIDTARHVNPEFWQRFIPAMLARAQARGTPGFHIFGEVFSEEVNPGYLAEFTRRDGFPAVLDFSFQAAVRQAVGRGMGTAVFERWLNGDVLYEGGADKAMDLPTFTGNHDLGRIATLIRADQPDIGADELLARTTLAHAMLLTLRGQAVIYAGDEQGFIGDGNDQAAREDQFPSRVVSYNDNDLLGTGATTADENFDEGHPLFRLIARLSAMRRENAALTRGRSVIRARGTEPGLFAVSRFDPTSGREVLLLYNTSDGPISANVAVEPGSMSWTSLSGTCAPSSTVPGSVAVTLLPLAYAVCEAKP